GRPPAAGRRVTPKHVTPPCVEPTHGRLEFQESPGPRRGFSFKMRRMTANPLRWTFRAQCLLGFAVCAALLAFALYTQYFLALVPCPLCIFQRVAFAALGLVLLVAGLHAPRGAGGRRTYG